MSVGTSEEKFTYPTDYEVPAKRARLLADGSTDSAAAVRATLASFAPPYSLYTGY